MGQLVGPAGRGLTTTASEPGGSYGTTMALCMTSTHWDDRYAASELVWSASPNLWVEQLVADLPPGSALDLAGGEGRNSLWLAERGWQTTIVDFSQVALDRARQLAESRLGQDAGRVRTERADVLVYTPEEHGYDLVLVVYLHLPPAQRRAVLRRAASAVAANGRLLIVGHDRDNPASGVGGPQNPAVLYSPADIVEDLAGTGLHIGQAQQVQRPVNTDTGPRDALDCLVLADRP
jgi:SAM-dependent methyltransferase